MNHSKTVQLSAVESSSEKFRGRVETQHHVVGLRTREAGGTSDGMMSLRQIEVAA